MFGLVIPFKVMGSPIRYSFLTEEIIKTQINIGTDINYDDDNAE